MGLFGKKEKAPAQAPTTRLPANTSLGSTAPLTDPNLIRVFDEFGRELFITKEQWCTSILPGILKSNWNNPDRLYGIIVDSLNDGFLHEVLDAAEHLYLIDPVSARGACIYGIVLMENKCLDQAEHVLRSYIKKHGEDGYVLTNLAKVYSARDETQKAEATLWRALEVDPNQDNGLGWYAAIHRERSGEEAGLEALRHVAALPGSWRAQLWLARASLESHDLGRALTYYHEGLSRIGEEVPIDFLMQMSGDLGRSGHLSELLRLTEPRFVPEIHGLQVGNNLIKAHLDLGHIEAAHKVLKQLYALKRPDYKPHLSFWDTELAKARIAGSKIEGEEPLEVAIVCIEGPVWLKPSSPAAELYPAKPPDAPIICFLGSSAEVPSKSEHVQLQISDPPGRMSRALPLFLAEHVWFNSSARVQTLVPCITGKSAGFVLSGLLWRDEDAAKYSTQALVQSKFTVVTHLQSKTEPWTVELRMIRSIDRECVGELVASFQIATPGDALLDLAKQLLLQLAGQAQIETQRLPVPYEVPAGVNFPTYLLRLEQLLAVRCAGMEGVQPTFLSGEREIIDGNLQLCVAYPESVGIRVLLAQTLLAMQKVRPDVVVEFKEKIMLLQQRCPLKEPSHGVIQRMLSEALTGGSGHAIRAHLVKQSGPTWVTST